MGPLPWWVYSILSVLTDGLVASGGPEVGFMFRENSQRTQGAGMGMRLPVPCLPDSCTGPTGQQLPLPKPGLYLPQAHEWARLLPLPVGTPQDLLWQQMRVMTRDSRRTPQSPAKGAQMKILQSKSKPLLSTVKNPANGI